MEDTSVYYENLRGIRASFIGDSLFGGHGIGKENSWIALLGDKYGMEYNNYGSNGCTLSACEGGANPIVGRFSEIAENNPHLIVVEGGRNDYNKGAELGEIGGDIKTFRGALSRVLLSLREKFPEATIVCVTFWRVGPRENTIGLPTSAYTDAMMEVARELSFPYIDATNTEESLVDMTNPEFRKEFCWVPGDVCHLNCEGMKRVMPFFERKLSEILASK